MGREQQTMKKKERKKPELPEGIDQQQGQTTQEPPETANAATTGEQVGANALKQLRRAVRKKVREQSTEIADSLVTSALAGNSSSARIMVSLVEKKKKKDKSKAIEGKPLRSLALDLASDPECPPEDDDWAREDQRVLREPEADPKQPIVPDKDRPS
jgi:hypothetical protein